MRGKFHFHQLYVLSAQFSGSLVYFFFACGGASFSSFFFISFNSLSTSITQRCWGRLLNHSTASLSRSCFFVGGTRPFALPRFLADVPFVPFVFPCCSATNFALIGGCSLLSASTTQTIAIVSNPMSSTRRRPTSDGLPLDGSHLVPLRTQQGLPTAAHSVALRSTTKVLVAPTYCTSIAPKMLLQKFLTVSVDTVSAPMDRCQSNPQVEHCAAASTFQYRPSPLRSLRLRDPSGDTAHL